MLPMKVYGLVRSALILFALLWSCAVWASDFADKVLGLERIELHSMIEAGLLRPEGSHVYVLGRMHAGVKHKLEYVRRIAQLSHLNVVLFGDIAPGKKEATILGFDGILFDQRGQPLHNFSMRVRSTARIKVLRAVKEAEDDIAKPLLQLGAQGWDSTSETFASQRDGEAFYKLLYGEGPRPFCMIGDFSEMKQDVDVLGTETGEGKLVDVFLSAGVDEVGQPRVYALDRPLPFPIDCEILAFSNGVLVFSQADKQGQWIPVSESFVGKVHALVRVHLQDLITANLVHKESDRVYALGSVPETERRKLQFLEEIAQVLDLKVVLFGQRVAKKQEARTLGYDGILFDSEGEPKWNFSLRARRQERQNVISQLEDMFEHVVQILTNNTKIGWNDRAFVSQPDSLAYFKLLFFGPKREHCLLGDLRDTQQDVFVNTVNTNTPTVSTAARSPWGVTSYALGQKEGVIDSEVLVFKNVTVIRQADGTVEFARTKSSPDGHGRAHARGRACGGKDVFIGRHKRAK